MPKTVFITGASSGIGLASAQLFHEKGWNVVASMRSPDNAAAELRALNQDRILVVRLDVADHSTIQPAIQEAIAKFKTIDVLINNAGYGQMGVFEGVSREQVQAQFDVNLFGAMDMIRAVLPHFHSNNGGGIINVSGGVGFFGLPLVSLYCATKFALEGFTEAVSYELASQNIFVKSVIPNAHITSTSFGQSAATHVVQSHERYSDFSAKAMAKFQQLVAGSDHPASQVAQVIYEAATDGKNQLRYVTGDDGKGLLKARYETNSDEEYMAHQRAYFDF